MLFFYIYISNWSQVNSLCFSPSGSMLLATSGDETATIWSVPLETTWSPTPYVTLKGHKKAVFGGAFLGDESHVVTASEDNILRVWRTTDGKETANYNCSGRVRHCLFLVALQYSPLLQCRCHISQYFPLCFKRTRCRTMPRLARS